MSLKEKNIRPEHRGMFASWQPTVEFRKKWEQVSEVTLPENPMAKIVTREDPIHKNMAYEIGLHMGGNRVFSAEMLENLEITLLQPKIGVFGGSFDPIHNEHIQAALDAAEKHNLHHIRLFPAGLAPQKAQQPPIAFHRRQTMVELAIQPHPILSCDPREGHRNGPSFTIDTLEELKSELPGCELHLLIGTDQMKVLESWYRIRDILQIAKLNVMDRPVGGISSTEIRKRLVNQQAITGLVPETVEQYLKIQKLYAPK